MSFDMNSVNLTGRLTAPPVLSQVGQKQTDVCKFSVAVGAGKETTYFFDVQCWGKVATNVNSYVGKGSKVGISGELQHQRWEKDGQKKSKIIINASSVIFLSTKEEQGHKPAPQAQAPANDPFDEIPDVKFEEGNTGPDENVPF